MIEAKCLLFVDDIVLFAHSEHELQFLLNIWSRIWDITFYPNKCNVKSIFVSRPFSPLDNNIIKTVLYLGLIIDVQVDFKNAITTLAQSGTRALGVLIYKNKIIGLSVHMYNTLYNVCVVHVITYCSSMWGTKKLSRLVTVQNKAMRNYVCVNIYTLNCCTIGDMGWTDISEEV